VKSIAIASIVSFLVSMVSFAAEPVCGPHGVPCPTFGGCCFIDDETPPDPVPIPPQEPKAVMQTHEFKLVPAAATHSGPFSRLYFTDKGEPFQFTWYADGAGTFTAHYLTTGECVGLCGS
jgi:hypothetical protein